MYEVLLIAIGVFIGLFMAAVAIYASTVGTLRIDQSDPSEAPYPFLEGTKPLPYIMSKKFIVLRVNVQNYLSQ